MNNTPENQKLPLRAPSARVTAALAAAMLAVGIVVGAAIGPAPSPSQANPSLPLLLTGGALGGAGAGAVFKGGISTVLEIAPEDARGEALAGLFLAAYLGLAMPVIALGFASQALSLRTALLGFSILLAVVIALVARKLLVRRPA